MPATEAIIDCETGLDAGEGGTLLGSLTIPGRLALVAIARAFASMVLSDHVACAADAVLLVSELVANSIRHSDSGRDGGTVTVALFVVGDRLRAEVTDAGGLGTPASAPPGGCASGADEADLTDLEEAGRGLQLVELLSTRWGWRRAEAGTVTWFELAGAAL